MGSYFCSINTSEFDLIPAIAILRKVVGVVVVVDHVGCSPRRK